jgi:hypothetical protein
MFRVHRIHPPQLRLAETFSFEQQHELAEGFHRRSQEKDAGIAGNDGLVPGRPDARREILNGAGRRAVLFLVDVGQPPSRTISVMVWAS